MVGLPKRKRSQIGAPGHKLPCNCNTHRPKSWRQGRFRHPMRAGDCYHCGEHWQRHSPLDNMRCPTK